MPTPAEILETIYQRAIEHADRSFIDDPRMAKKVKDVSINLSNRACVRFLMSCLLAKIHNPSVDIRKPYTEIDDVDVYSGRTYDEQHLNKLIHDKELPCNPTTAFLTPAFRNRNITLTPSVNLVGRPKELYQATLDLLSAVHNGEVSPELLLSEILRDLLILKWEREKRIKSLIDELNTVKGTLPLSSEDIVALIEQHLCSPKSSRLPVLVVAAAYKAASDNLCEQVLPLASHNAADKQTRNLGDLEITLVGDDNVVTSYEMKTRKVTKEDVEDALTKIR